MPVYDVTVRFGNRVNVKTLVASDEKDAVQIARRDGGVVSGVPRRRKEMRSGGMSPGERYVFLNRLATMTVGQVPLSSALGTMRDAFGPNSRIGKAASSLEAGIASGRQIADLMYEDKRNFPGAVGLLVRAGAKGAGGAADAFRKAAEFEREILNASVKGARGIWGASFWVTTGAAGVLACPLWLTPYLKGSQLFELVEGPVSWTWLDNVSLVVGGIMLIMMLMAMFLFFVVVVGQRFFPGISDRIVMLVPILREIVFARDNFVSLYRFALMVKAGVTMEEALESTWKDTRKGALKADLGRAMANIKRGRPWAQDFRTVHPTDRAAMAMATDRERLGNILEEVADQNKALYIRRLEMLEPVFSFTGGMAMVALYGVAGLYSIVPFAVLFEKLMGVAYGVS